MKAQKRNETMEADKDILIFTTFGDRDLAEEFISELLEQDLVVSGTIFPEVELIYKWEGKVTIDTENKILFKAKASNYEKVENYILKKHPYIAPEIIRLEASFGSDLFKEKVKTKISKLKP